MIRPARMILSVALALMPCTAHAVETVIVSPPLPGMRSIPPSPPAPSRPCPNVSLIRKEMCEVIPIYRNSESDLCLPFACRETEGSSLDGTQPPEKTGGGGSLKRNRLWPQAHNNREKYREANEATLNRPS
jgi:hypothetical protein